MKKRDTMIRELKSKLKEKFKEGSSESEEQESVEAEDDDEEVNKSSVPVAGTVESRRETMGPKLAAMFANRMAKETKGQEKPPSANSNNNKELPFGAVPVLPIPENKAQKASNSR